MNSSPKTFSSLRMAWVTGPVEEAVEEATEAMEDNPSSLEICWAGTKSKVPLSPDVKRFLKSNPQMLSTFSTLEIEMCTNYQTKKNENID